jgi:hypothetical protein
MKSKMSIAYDETTKLFAAFKRALLWIDEALYKDTATNFTGYINFDLRSENK